jgi:hypothetical protein
MTKSLHYEVLKVPAAAVFRPQLSHPLSSGTFPIIRALSPSVNQYFWIFQDLLISKYSEYYTARHNAPDLAHTKGHFARNHLPAMPHC